MTTTPDITEMTAVHRVFRDAFAMAPQLVSSAADGDAERTAVVASFYRNVLEFLHCHHAGEDELLFPKLAERSGNPELVATLAAQHEGVQGALDGANAAIEGWSASAAAADGAKAVAAIGVLDVALTAHLNQEEQDLLPLIAGNITVEEWGELPAHAMGHFRGDNMFLIIGLVRDKMTEEQRDRMLDAMPPPAVAAWKAVGIDAYRADVQALVGAPA